MTRNDSLARQARLIPCLETHPNLRPFADPAPFKALTVLTVCILGILSVPMDPRTRHTLLPLVHVFASANGACQQPVIRDPHSLRGSSQLSH